MIPISRARFTLDAPYLGEEDLESYALTLFHRFDNITQRVLPLPDFALRLELDEGSLKGRGLVLAAAGGLYFAIGQFGDFVQGVREMRALGRYVADKLVQEAPRQLHLPPKSVMWARRDSAKLGQLERLFERVRDGELDPHSATVEAVRVLEEDGDVLPPEFVADMTAAVRTIRRDWKQLEMPLEAVMASPDDSAVPVPPSPPRFHRDTTALPRRRKLHIEVYRSSKDGEELVTIVPLE